MSLESIGIAVGVFIAIGGALIQIIKVIVQHTTDEEFDKLKEQMAKEFGKNSDRVYRLERRQAMLEMQVKGDSDTFSDD